jgi:PKD repeat protein
VRRAPFLLGLAAAFAVIALLPCAAWAKPFAGFTYEPASPLTQERVSFESTATTDPGATIDTREWDLDGDGKFDDAFGQSATFTYQRPGARLVASRVVDSAGNQDTHRERLVIGNRAPVVSFFSVPSAPSPGEPVTFHSTSSDPDGFLTGQAWDLNDDGNFSDYSGSSVTLVFPAPGQYRIGLRVVDDSGAASTLVLAISVGAAPAAPPGPGVEPPVPQLVTASGQVVSVARVMSPFPIVRLSGIVRKRGIKLRVLSVSGPLGASLSVRCRGRGCPFRRKIRTIEAHARATAGLAPATGLVRIQRFRRKLLRVGATVKVYVAKPDAIGKYTRLKVRRGSLPARVDRCIAPGSQTPVPCPTG